MLSPIACHTRHSDQTPNICDITTRRAKIDITHQTPCALKYVMTNEY